MSVININEHHLSITLISHLKVRSMVYRCLQVIRYNNINTGAKHVQLSQDLWVIELTFIWVFLHKLNLCVIAKIKRVLIGSKFKE